MSVYTLVESCIAKRLTMCMNKQDKNFIFYKLHVTKVEKRNNGVIAN